MAALGHLRCTVCLSTAGNNCMSCQTANPSLEGCWDFYTDEALIVLLADASTELGRRSVPLKVIAA